jgi:hypothetical protein
LLALGAYLILHVGRIRVNSVAVNKGWFIYSHNLAKFNSLMPFVGIRSSPYSPRWQARCHRLRGLTSNVCGHYYCIYALHRARGLSMTSFVNMFFTCSLHLQRYKGSAHVRRSVWRVPRLQTTGAAAAVVQVADIN